MGGVEQAEGFFDEYFACHFAEGSPGYVIVTVKAAVIDLCQHVAEGVVGKAEKEVVAAVHLALQIKPDVGQGLAGDGEDLSIAHADEVHSSRDASVLVRGKAQWGERHDGAEYLVFHWEFHSFARTSELRLCLDWRIGDDIKGLAAEEMADTDAFVPGLNVFAVRASAVGCDHAAEGAVHEDAGAAYALLDAVVQGAYEVRAENPLFRADYLRVAGVIYERGDGLGFEVEGLDDIAPLVIELLSVVIVGDLALCPPCGDLDGSWLQIADSLVNRVRQF